MKTVFVPLLTVMILSGCNFSKSVKKDLISGLTTTGTTLSCDDVYLTVNNERTTRNTFTYGESVYLVFNDIQGFAKENGKVFPSMDILVTNLTGDTVISAANLYAEYTEGMDYTPLQLTADITVATPIRSGGEYLLSVTIKDRKGPGIYSSKLKFTVGKSEQVQVEVSGAAYDEAYIFSQDKGMVINNGKVSFDDNIYIIIEGLKGFKEENGSVFPGLSLKAFDAEKKVILDYADLFSEYEEKGIDTEDFASRVSSHFKISGTVFDNPMELEMLVWDKRSSTKILIKARLTIE
jgi:hypothetical protein